MAELWVADKWDLPVYAGEWDCNEWDLYMQVDAISEALMPAGVRGLRSMFHATAVEVLLYLTPVHCQDMLDSLTTSMNATYSSFMKRNPAFKV